jgi:hypothetical protein
MRITHRLAASVVLIVFLSIVPATSSSAGFVISYWGLTSQDRIALLEIVKRDSGARFLREMTMFLIVTCEDTSTHEFAISFDRQKRLGEGGEFELARVARPGEPNSVPYRLQGVVRFGAAEGTFELSYTSFRQDGKAQLCTSGVVEWTLARGHGPGERPPVADDVTFLETGRRGEVVQVAGP